MQLATQAPTRQAKRGPTTETERSMIVSLFLDGYRPSEIGDQIGRSRAATDAAIEAAGYNPRRYSYSEAEADKWVTMYDGTWDTYPWSIVAIAHEAGHACGTIRTALSDRGCRIRHLAKAVSLAHQRKRAMDQ